MGKSKNKNQINTNKGLFDKPTGHLNNAKSFEKDSNPGYIHYGSSVETHNRGRQLYKSVIEKATSGIKVLINPQVWKDVDLCLQRCQNVEFSGIILYTKKGSLSDLGGIVLTVEHFLLMDIGTAGYTEFTFDSDLMNFCMEHGNIIPNTTHYIGKLHSHHNMSSYHSGVDVDDILLNLDVATQYLSIVVNNRWEIDTRFGIYKEIETYNKTKYYDIDEKLIELEKRDSFKEAILYDCKTSVNILANTTVDKKLEELMSSKMSSIVTKSWETPSTYSNPNNNLNIWHSRNSRWGMLPQVDLDNILKFTEFIEENAENCYEVDFSLHIIKYLGKEGFARIFSAIFDTNVEKRVEGNMDIGTFILDNALLYKENNNNYFKPIGYEIIVSFCKAIYNMDAFVKKNNSYIVNFKSDVINVIRTTSLKESIFMCTLLRELTEPNYKEVLQHIENLKKGRTSSIII